MLRLGTVSAAGLCGAVGAALYLAAPVPAPGALILAYLSQLPLFAAGLWFGVSAAALAGFSASLILLAASGLLATLLFIGLDAVPVVVLVRQALLARPGGSGALEWYPAGMLAAWLTALALAIGGAAVLLLGGPAGLETELREKLAPVLARLAGEVAPVERDGIAGFLAAIIPGVALASWMTMTAINGVLAQGVLARFGANWRPSPDLSALSLPRWMPVLLAVAVAAASFGGTSRFLGITLLILLAVPFSLAGLAVLHTFARRLSHPAAVLAWFYVLAGVLGWPMLLVAALGLVDSAIGLRRRLVPP